jgi:DNA topoisomerase I
MIRFYPLLTLRGMSLPTLTPLDPVASAKQAGLRYVNGAEPGITRKRSGRGFVYLDAHGRPVHDAKVLARIRSLVIPPAWEKVWICPLEEGHLQATGRDQRGRKQYRYHPKYRLARDENKFGRMLAFAEVLPKIRGQLKEDLALHGLPKRKVLAAVVTLLDRTCIRVGNEAYAKENNSYGLTTLHDRHVDVSPPRIRFHFRGKSGQLHDLELMDPKLAKIVKQCRDLPGYELFQYVDDHGEHATIDSSDVNDYLREMTGEDFTAKDFRTWHGSGHAAQLLAEMGRAESEAQMKRNIVAAVKATAALLGNRPATCRKYYIHPCVAESYTAGTIFSVVESVAEDGDLRREECVIKMLVKEYVTRSSRRGSPHAFA